MALSRPKETDRDGVTILRESAQYFNEALKQFRVCHDLCQMADMLGKAPVRELDQCAVRFRQLSIFGATLSEKVASVWCGTCSLFYRNLSKLQQKDPSKILTTISKNARELSNGFIHLSKCANILASKFQYMKVGSRAVPVQEAFVETFREEERRAAEEKASSQMMLEQVKQKIEAAKEDVRHQKERSSYTTYFTGSTRPVLHDAAQNLENAKEMEELMEAQFKEAEKKLREQKDQTKKAEVLAGELSKLMGMLQIVAAACKDVGGYFDKQADKFQGMATAATTGEELGEKFGLDEDKAKAKAELLADQKNLLEKYHRSMAVINSSYNFQTTFKPEDQLFTRDELTSIHLEGLGVGVSWD